MLSLIIPHLAHQEQQTMSASFKDYLKSGSLYFLPHHAISRVVFKLTRIESRFVPKAITLFSNAFGVNLEEALNPDASSYKNFNKFFTRELKEGLRPIANAKITSPVDGTISQFGKVIGGNIIQAKGVNYSLGQLLGGNQLRTDKFTNGQFITIYLSPKDYHRLHMPCDGKLVEQTHIPGRLFSVANHTVNTIKGIFAPSTIPKKISKKKTEASMLLICSNILSIICNP